MLAKNKSGWKLLEYIDIQEKDVEKYRNVTGAYAILRVADKYVVGYNGWRKQWEFPAGRIDNGETAREAAIRELYEETHQRNEQLEFRGLFRVEDAKGQIKYLSMGMTNDYMLAIKHGANIVRVGRAIFGERESR